MLLRQKHRRDRKSGEELRRIAVADQHMLLFTTDTPTNTTTTNIKKKADLLLNVVKVCVFRFHLCDFVALRLDFLAIRFMLL